MSVEKLCEYCGTKFVDRSRGQHGRWCSEKCKGRVNYETNHEKRVAYQRTYNEANVEKVTTYQRAWYKTNHEKKATYQRAYYESNREKVAESQRAYAQANSEKMCEKTARRRAHKRGAFVADVDREAISKRDDYKCQLCGEEVDTKKKWPDPMSPSIDHILPLSRGGTHEPDNVQLAHLRCNLKKHNRVTL